MELDRRTRLRRIVSWGFGIAFLLGVAGLLYSEWDGRRQYAEDFALYSSRPLACEAGSQLRLDDGRMLGYRDIGPRGGDVLLYFHGGLGSRLEWPQNQDLLEELSLRVIGVDRPGYGCSSPSANRSVADWAGDIRQLAEALRLEKFRVAGWSSGAPFALAVAAKLPERVTRVDLISAAVPPEMQTTPGLPVRVQRFVLARAPGFAYRQMAALRARRAEDPEAFERELWQGLPEPDREVAGMPEIRSLLRQSTGEAMRQSALGFFGDVKAINQPWGFALADVSAPVILWHGAADTYLAPANAETLGQALQHAEVRIVEGTGHLLLYPREREILEAR